MREIEKLNVLRQLKAHKNGAEKSEQAKTNQLSVYECVNAFFDEGSFIETDAFVRQRELDLTVPADKVTTEGVVTGYGTVDARLVFVYAQDSAVMGGSVGEMHAKKIVKLMKLALKAGAPVVAILDSAGGRIKEGLEVTAGYGEIFNMASKLSGIIPQIAVVAGNCVGSAAVLAAMNDFVIMAQSGKLYYQTGAALGDLSDSYGDVDFNSKNGAVDLKADDVLNAVSLAKMLVGYLPANNLSDPLEELCSDDLSRTSEELTNIFTSDNISYDALQVVAQVADNGQVIVLKEDFAKAMLTAFIKVNGRTVGVVANQPGENEGFQTCESLDKASAFVRFCNAFNLPVVTFVDTKGFEMKDSAKTTKSVAKLSFTYAEAVVPKVTMILGKASGVSYIAMGSVHLGADLVFALPGAQISVLSSDAASDILFGEELLGAEDPIAKRQQLVTKYADVYANPYIAAAKAFVDDVIEPNSLRPRMVSALEMLYAKRQENSIKRNY